MKKKNSTLANCVQTNVTCVKWNLPPITCLGIDTGDTMDLVTFAILDKVCNTLGTTDLSEIELQCIIDKLDATDPGERTIVNLFQLAFENDCKLYDLIQEVRDLIEDDTPLSLDLKCLAEFDSFGNQLPYNEQTVLQSLITNVCLLVDQLADIVQDLVEINIRIDNLPAPYEEPELNTCLSGTPKSTSETVVLLATDYCSFKPKVGLVAEIDEAIGSQPTIVDNTDPLFANPDLINPPTSLANSDVNQWVFIENMLQRLKELEECACKFDCSDIKIEFNVEDQEDGEQVILNFSGDYGNFIPEDFDVDTDSKITFIDKNKNQKSYTIPVGNINTLNTEWVTPPYDISMLDLSGLITVKVCVKMINTETGQVCCKCQESQHMFTGACSFCELTATNDVTIVFVNSNDVTQMVTILAGETYVLPSNSTIISISDVDDLEEVPECLDLTNLEESLCYIVRLNAFDDSGALPFEADSSNHLLTGFYLNNIFKPFTGGAVSGAYDPYSPYGLFPANLITVEMVAKIPGIIDTNFSYRNTSLPAFHGTTFMQIKTVPSIARNLFLEIKATGSDVSGPTSPAYYRVPFYEYDDVIDDFKPDSLCEEV